MRFNLLYNCCAFDWNAEWLLNIQKLNQHATQFNGRKLVVLRTGEHLLSTDEVQRAFAFEAEFVVLPNDPAFGETYHLREVVGKLRSVRADEFTFYAHTKGVGYRQEKLPWIPDFTPDRNLVAVRRWRDDMYEQCLGPEVWANPTRGKATSGCFLRPYAVRSWAFHGTFFWLNHAKWFAADWDDFPPLTEGGMEAYPGRLFPIDDAVCLFDRDQHLSPYQRIGRFNCPNCRRAFEDVVCFESSLCCSCGTRVDDADL